MASILNNILCTLMLFFLTFAWAVYCLRDATWAFFLASVVAACGCYIIFALLSKRKISVDKTQKRKKQLKDFFTFLQFCEDLESVFCPMLKFFGYTVEKINFETAIVTKEKRCLATFCFEKDCVCSEQIRNAVILAKRCDCSEILLFCNKTDNAMKKLAESQIKTEFIDIANSFELFQTAEKLPEFTAKSAPKNHPLPQYMFDKKRFGWYFFGAIFTLATAVVSLLKLYLLIWATILFALAFYSLFNKKFNKITTNIRL